MIFFTKSPHQNKELFVFLGVQKVGGGGVLE